MRAIITNSIKGNRAEGYVGTYILYTVIRT